MNRTIDNLIKQQVLLSYNKTVVFRLKELFEYFATPKFVFIANTINFKHFNSIYDKSKLDLSRDNLDIIKQLETNFSQAVDNVRSDFNNIINSSKVLLDPVSTKNKIAIIEGLISSLRVIGKFTPITNMYNDSVYDGFIALSLPEVFKRLNTAISKLKAHVYNIYDNLDENNQLKTHITNNMCLSCGLNISNEYLIASIFEIKDLGWTLQNKHFFIKDWIDSNLPIMASKSWKEEVTRIDGNTESLYMLKSFAGLDEISIIQSKLKQTFIDVSNINKFITKFTKSLSQPQLKLLYLNESTLKNNTSISKKPIKIEEQPIDIGKDYSINSNTFINEDYKSSKYSEISDDVGFINEWKKKTLDFFYPAKYAAERSYTYRDENAKEQQSKFRFLPLIKKTTLMDRAIELPDGNLQNLKSYKRQPFVYSKKLRSFKPLRKKEEDLNEWVDADLVEQGLAEIPPELPASMTKKDLALIKQMNEDAKNNEQKDESKSDIKDDDSTSTALKMNWTRLPKGTIKRLKDVLK